MWTLESLIKLFRLCAHWRIRDYLTWEQGGDDSPLVFYLDCSRLFQSYATDREPLWPGDLLCLEQALMDVNAVIKSSKYGVQLYCCRRRLQMPHNYNMRRVPMELRKLFTACQRKGA